MIFSLQNMFASSRLYFIGTCFTKHFNSVPGNILGNKHGILSRRRKEIVLYYYFSKYFWRPRVITREQNCRCWYKLSTITKTPRWRGLNTRFLLTIVVIRWWCHIAENTHLNKYKARKNISFPQLTTSFASSEQTFSTVLMTSCLKSSLFKHKLCFKVMLSRKYYRP